MDYFNSLTSKTINAITKIKSIIAVHIHKGLNTHHHDQSIYLVSFNPINNMVNKPKNPIPLFDEPVLLILIPPYFNLIKMSFVFIFTLPLITNPQVFRE